MAVSTTIDEVITDAKDFAETLLEEARDLVNDANRIAEGRSYANVLPFTWEMQEEDDDAFIDENLPNNFSDSFQLPDATAITDVAFLDPYIPVTPSFPDAPDELDTRNLFDIDRPDWNLADFTTAAPNINTSQSYPAAPSLNLPETPVSSDDTLTVPTVVAPTFDDQMDVSAIGEVDVTGRIADEFAVTREQLVAAADSHAESWLTLHDPNYYSAKEALEARITETLEGGSAMNEAWEQAIYDRALIRTTDEQHRAQQALSEDYARRGFAVPPGAVMGGLARIRYEQSRNTADISAQIANERARIELQHLQFGMQLSANLRQAFASAMQNYMQIVLSANGQALQYAQEIGRWAAELFNQRVEIYRLEQARYQLESQVYAVRLESAFAQIRVFEVEIEAEKLKIEVDRNAIALYEAQIKGEMSKIDIYNSQLQAIRTQLEAEATKLSVYESQVRAYAARVGAKESEYNAYRAAIQGDAEKVNAYQSQVQAYSATVQAAGTKVDSEARISQSIADYNKLLIEQRDSNIRKYVADVDAEGARFSGGVEAYKTDLAKYTTEVEGRLRFITTRYERERLLLSAEVAKIETNLRAQISNVEGFIRSIIAQADITQSGGRIIGDMGASVLSTNNTLLTSEET